MEKRQMTEDLAILVDDADKRREAAVAAAADRASVAKKSDETDAGPVENCSD